MKAIELRSISLMITSLVFQLTSGRDAEHIYSDVHDAIACVLGPFMVF